MATQLVHNAVEREKYMLHAIIVTEKAKWFVHHVMGKEEQSAYLVTALEEKNVSLVVAEAIPIAYHVEVLVENNAVYAWAEVMTTTVMNVLLAEDVVTKSVFLVMAVVKPNAECALDEDMMTAIFVMAMA